MTKSKSIKTLLGFCCQFANYLVNYLIMYAGFASKTLIDYC